MIINHTKKFIFFANRKTGSTSAAIALSSSCSHKDVITPLGRDERIRSELGYQGPTNFIPWWNKHRYLAIKAKRKLFKTDINRDLKNMGLHTHIKVNEVLERKYINAKILEDYFSFCFIRNPWDHTISQFYELQKDPRHANLDLNAFINNGRLEKFAQNCRSIYSENGVILVSKLYQYENFQEAIQSIFKKLNLSGDPTLPRAKSNLRTDRRHYREVLNNQQATAIERIFYQEVKWGNYQF